MNSMIVAARASEKRAKWQASNVLMIDRVGESVWAKKSE